MRPEDTDACLPASNSEYQDAEYWNRRYSTEPYYEWLAGFQELHHLMEETLVRFGHQAKILQLGCGNSDLALHLHQAGFTEVTNIDISGVCVQNMRTKYPALTFLEMDMTAMDFPDGSFDLVFEKSTLDSLLVSSPSPWDMSSSAHTLVTSGLREVKRVMQPEGVFFSVTFCQPHHRVPLLTQEGLRWAVQVDRVGDSSSLLEYCVMRMEEGGVEGAEEARARYGIGKGPCVEYVQDLSEDEEDFINNLRICSDDEDSNEGQH